MVKICKKIKFINSRANQYLEKRSLVGHIDLIMQHKFLWRTSMFYKDNQWFW